MAQRRSGAKVPTSSRNGTLSTTDGCDRGARPRILRHCTRDLRAGRRDASATAARPPAASLALHRRARQAVIPRRPGPKVRRLLRRQVTDSCCLLLSRASPDDPLPGSVASITARVHWRLHQTSLWGYKWPPYGRLRKACRTFAPSATVAAGGLSAARPAHRSRHGGRAGRPSAALGRTRPCADATARLPQITHVPRRHRGR